MKTGEQILAEGCGRGDNAARRELYDRYAALLLGLCQRYVGDRATAEDVLHDAFLKIFGAIGRFRYRGEGSLRAWMERIAVNTALEHLRRERRLGEVRLEENRALPAAAEPSNDEVARIPREVLLRLVGELPDGYRTVFNLFCIEGYPHREIAAMLGINEKSSSSQLARARALLARKLRAWLDTHEL